MGGAPRVVWMTFGSDPKALSAWSVAHRLIEEKRPCHLVWDPETGDIAQLLPIVRAGCALGTRENVNYVTEETPHRLPGANREGRLCVQIGVVSSPRVPFTTYQMIGLGEIMTWLDSWQIPRRWPAGTPAPFRHPGRPASRALWSLGGHFGASQVPACASVGPGSLDIDQIVAVGASGGLGQPEQPDYDRAGRPLAERMLPAPVPADRAAALHADARSPSFSAAERWFSTAGVLPVLLAEAIGCQGE
jgi:hypothetical protein